MKRIIAIILAFLLTFVVCGCEENTATTITFENRLPKVIYSATDGNMKYTDMVNLKDGGYAVSGYRYFADYIESIIRIYDNDNKLIDEYSDKQCNGFDKIAVCSDGGFVAASYNSPCVTKVNSKLETEYVVSYEDATLEGRVQDIEEISSECIAVLFLNNAAMGNRLKIAFFDSNGYMLETIDAMESVSLQDADIEPDGEGGFYLITTCNQTLADKYATVIGDKYDANKGNEIAIIHFSNQRQVTEATVFGSDGNDWVEEAIMDKDGSFYIAIGTDNPEKNDFWDMPVDSYDPIRRMLVKISKDGGICYKAPLSNQGLEKDSIFGIHIKDDKAYVGGLSEYLDGYQNQYSCEQISKEDYESRISVVYFVCFNMDGQEEGRSIFRLEESPSDSVIFSDGSIAIAGPVSYNENTFSLDIPEDADYSAALFILEN